MKLKIGDYASWTNGKGRYIIFRVYNIKRGATDYYETKSIYDNQYKYPRKPVYFPIKSDNKYQKLTKEDALDLVMVESL